MEKSETIRILRSLASGVDPQTGIEIPLNSPYRHIKTTRALLTVVKELEEPHENHSHEELELMSPRARQARERIKPQMDGSPWSPLEDQELREDFRKGLSIAAMARKHQRTQGAISSRLLRSGIGIIGIIDNDPSVSSGLAKNEADNGGALAAHSTE